MIWSPVPDSAYGRSARRNPPARLANTSVTRYESTDGELRLIAFNAIDHLAGQDEDITEEPHAAEQS